MLKPAFWAVVLVAGGIAPAFAQPASPSQPEASAQLSPSAGGDPSGQHSSQQSSPSTSATPMHPGEIRGLVQRSGTQRSPESGQSAGRYAQSQGYPESRGEGDYGIRPRRSEREESRGEGDYRIRPRWPEREGRNHGWEEQRERSPWRRFHERRAYMPPRAVPPEGGLANLCGADPSRVSQSITTRIERVTRPSADQRDSFQKLKEAVARGADIMRNACAAERPITPTGKLAVAEKRLSGMLEAVRAVRPALETYYNTLNDEQKMRLTLAQRHAEGHGMGSRRDEPENRPTWRRGEEQPDFTGALPEDDDDDDDSER